VKAWRRRCQLCKARLLSKRQYVDYLFCEVCWKKRRHSRGCKNKWKGANRF
jgi:hypothetical protein